MSPERLEKMVFLKLKPHLIPDVKELDMRLGENRRMQAEGNGKALKSQAADAGKSVVVDCSL